MNVLDLFSGIGGFSLGLERAGFKTVAFCEIDPYARAVLRKHWPDVPCYEDVRTVTADRLRADGIHADVICGGFPCQDISSAGHKVGIAGPRSSLWEHAARLICELRPRYVVVENVAALLARGVDIVLGDLAEIGYDAEWHCISAAAIGACHYRDRFWLIGYPNSDRKSGLPIHAEMARHTPSMADAECWLGPLGRFLERGGWQQELDSSFPWLGAPENQPEFLGVDARLPARMDRLRCLGNAVVPQIPEIIGRAIMAAENRC